MKDYIRYIGITSNANSAMLQVKDQDKNAMKSAVDFWSKTGEKVTFNQSTGKFFLNSFFPSFPSLAWEKLADGFNKISFSHKRIPIQADIAITGDCHCNCWHCYHNNDETKQLSVMEIQRCFKELQTLGTCTIGITGGEPMLHPKIYDIISMIPSTMEGQLYTTGHGINKEFSAFLDKSRITRCIISLDHYKEEKANKLRGYKYAFSDAINAIEFLYNTNIYTSITVCITEQLLIGDELEKYFLFVNQLPINEIRIILPIPQGKLHGKDVRIVYANAIRKIKWLKRNNALSTNTPTVLNFCEFESSSYIGCSAGVNYMAINNDGNVLPCVAVPLSFGNIRTHTINEIFKTMEEYFKSSGVVCYGKQIGKIMSGEADIDISISPLSLENSKKIASKYVVQGRRGSFFEHIKENIQIGD